MRKVNFGKSKGKTVIKIVYGDKIPLKGLLLFILITQSVKEYKDVV